LGATFFIPTLIVPLLLMTHGLTCRILLQHQSQPALAETSGQRKTMDAPPVHAV
jgi:hypothetical protein